MGHMIIGTGLCIFHFLNHFLIIGWKDLKILNFKSLTCDCNSLECPDATICSDNSDLKQDIAVYAGYVIDSIEINGKRFVKEGGDRIDVELQHGETILKMVYGISRLWPGYGWNNAICGLTFITNLQILGPYNNPYCASCGCEFEYLVSIRGTSWYMMVFI